MILTRTTTIKISTQNLEHYLNLGYDIALGDVLEIPIELLPKGSNIMIRCKCDTPGCGIEKDVIFKNYIKYGNEWNKYLCRKCSEIKRKNTLKRKIGVEYPLQSKDIVNKKLSTMELRYKED